MAGEFSGSLNNGGETIQIIDSLGENILEFSYEGGWFPMADDQGHSLIVRDPSETSFKDFDLVRNWGVSPGGWRGILGLIRLWWDSLTKVGNIKNFTDAQLADPLVSGAGADLDGDSLSNLFEYALGLDPFIADEHLGYKVSIQEIEGVDRQIMTYRTQANAVDLVVTVEAGSDLVEWAQQTGLVEAPIDNGDGTVVLRVFGDTLVSDSEKTFMRLRVQVDSLN